MRLCFQVCFRICDKKDPSVPEGIEIDWETSTSDLCWWC